MNKKGTLKTISYFQNLHFLLKKKLSIVICNIILNRTNNHLLYTTPNVIQKRNEHDLVEDLKSELSMYKHNENIYKCSLQNVW